MCDRIAVYSGRIMLLLVLGIALLMASSLCGQQTGAVAPPSAVPLAERGDLNLNGLGYEVADLVVFQNYLFYGLDSLDPLRRDEQIAVSDINNDGIVLSFRDFTYLYRITLGDAIPYPDKSGRKVVAAFTHDAFCHTVSVSCPNNLAVLFLRFQGQVEPWKYAWPFSFYKTVQYDSQLDETMMIITCPGSASGCGGLVFRYDGDGVLLEAAAGDWLDSDVSTTMTVINAEGDRGDFDGNGRLNIADAACLVSYIFTGGPAPADSRHGDFTCDGVTDISDAVFLTCYLFASEWQPPCWYED